MSKVIFFRGFTDTPLKVVKDTPGSSACQACFFSLRNNPDTPGCPSWGEEKRAGAGNGCLAEHHHYTEHACAS
jgi:hypothetical protein